MSAPQDVSTARGLTSAQVAERVRGGLTNAEGGRPSRSVAQILRSNVLTYFNGLLAVMFVAILVFGQARDALFGLVLFTNMAIGIFEELRAKRTLDRLSVLASPGARVLRDGDVTTVPVADVVLDDVLELHIGEQIVADGEVLAADGLEIDESLLTGESRPVVKATGDPLMSGSFCVAGSGCMRATGVGAESYARRLAAEAKRFRRIPSELRRSTKRILEVTTALMVPITVLLIATRWPMSHDLHMVVPETVAALVGMVPQGLVLLSTIAFAVSVTKLARRKALIEELPAVEVLARVDVVCLDKTGTITEPELEVLSLEILPGGEAATAKEALGSIGCQEPAEARNTTARAIAAAFDGVGEVCTAGVPFSSVRGWSAVDLGDHGVWVFGAPDALLPVGDAARDRADVLARQGGRILLLARAGSLPAPAAAPPGLTPFALVVIEERIRADAADTLAFFRKQGVTLKVISGDAPATVEAIARRAGLEMIGTAVDASALPADPAGLADFMEAHTVFGRVRPEQKRDMIAALQARGHVVAMTGDGVNDVLALKTADMGIAMGSGAPAARAVAELVLLDDRFATLPDVLDEGRRVMANVERVASLFVTKTVYAALLALGAGVFAMNYPLLPRHFTLIDALTIGIPGLFLALAPAAPRYRPGLLPRVMRFTLVCGTVMTLATAVSYSWAVGVADAVRTTDVGEARTVAVLTLTFVGIWVLTELSRPLTRGRVALVLAMVAAMVAVMLLPAARAFLALPISPDGSGLVVAIATGVSVVAIEVGLRLVGWRPRPRDEAPA